VVSGVHEVESSSSVHLENSSIEVLRSSVELSTVSNVLLGISSVVSVGSEELSSSKAVGLIEGGELNSSGGVLDEDLGGVRRDPSIGDGVSGISLVDLNQVRSIGLIGTFSGVSGGVSITSSPLEVDVVSNSGVEVLRDEVVLSGGVSLDDVSSLSSDVQVVETSSSRDSLRSLGDLEGVRSILEGSSELRSIHGKFNLVARSVGDVEYGVLSVDRSGSVVVPVDEAGVGSRHIGISILNGRDVVSKSKDANASVVVDARREILELGDGHVVGVSKSRYTVSKLVLSRPGDHLAVRSSNSERRGIHPGVSLSSAISSVVLSGLSVRVGGRGVDAISLGLNVLRVSLVERAESLVGSQDGNISP